MVNISSGWPLYLLLPFISLVILLLFGLVIKFISPLCKRVENNQYHTKNKIIPNPPGPLPYVFSWKFLNWNHKHASDFQNIDSSSENEKRKLITKSRRGFTKQKFRWILLTAFLFFAGIGQFNFLNYPDGEKKGIQFYLLAITVFCILVWYSRNTLSSNENIQEHKDQYHLQLYFSGIKNIFRNKPIKSIFFGLSILLSILSLILLINRPENNAYWDIFSLWICSFLCYGFVFISKPNFHFLNWTKKNKVDVILIVIFTLLGGIFRFYKLGYIPSIIDGDEGRFGLIIVDILEGHITDMFSTILGNSSMYFFFIAGMMKLFGNSITILRIGSAIGGTLTIPVLYLMANRFFNRRTAIIAASVLAVSNFHIHFSHIMSVTSIQDAFFSTLSLYLFYTGLQNKSASRMTLSGLVLGFSLYIYMGARLIILLIPIYLLMMLFVHPQFIKRNTANIFIFGGALCIISLPMIYWAISNSALFNIRAYQVGVLQTGWLKEEAFQTGQPQIFIFFDLFKQAFLTTIFYPSHRFHYSSWPMLDMFSSIFFIAGLTYSLIYTRDSRYLLLNGWFWSGILVGGALVMLPSLNSYRILIVFPAMCLFTGIGLDKLLDFTQGNSRKLKTMETMAIVCFIILISFFNLKTYFFNFASNCRYEEPNTRLASRIATYASSLDEDVNLYLLTAPQLRANTHLSMYYLSPGRIYNEFVEPLTGPPENLELQNDYAFFLLPTRSSELNWIEEQFPGGTVDQIYDCNISVITVYLWIH